MVKKPRKRLAMYRTLPDGTVEKEYISYDDPILAKVILFRDLNSKICLGIIFVFQVPIQKREEVEKEVVIAKDKTASNFKVHHQHLYFVQIFYSGCPKNKSVQ